MEQTLEQVERQPLSPLSRASLWLCWNCFGSCLHFLSKSGSNKNVPMLSRDKGPRSSCESPAPKCSKATILRAALRVAPGLSSSYPPYPQLVGVVKLWTNASRRPAELRASAELGTFLAARESISIPTSDPS